MSLNVNKVEKKMKKNTVERKIIPVANHPAILAKVIDLGLQPQQPYEGQEKRPAYQLELTFEFPKQRIDINGESLPMHLSKRINMSQHEKSNCYAMFNALDPENKSQGDFGKLVGTAVLAQVINEAGQGKHEGRVFDKISSITAFPDIGAEPPVLETDALVFDTSNPDREMWDRIPEWLQTLVKGNLEFHGSRLQRFLELDPEDPEAQMEPTVNSGPSEPEATAEFDDDIPW